MRDWQAHWESGDTPWEKGAPAPPLLEYLEEQGCVFHQSNRVLVPGCGSGHDVRALAKVVERVRGLDLAAAAISFAGRFPIAGGEDYRQGSFFDERDEDGFDAIWEHTCFCAIQPEDRPRYVAAAARLLRPGGHLTGVFYLNPWDPGEDGEGPPFGATTEEIERLFAPDFSLKWQRVPQRSYPGREGREWLAVFERLAPDRGVAES